MSKLLDALQAIQNQQTEVYGEAEVLKPELDAVHARMAMIKAVLGDVSEGVAKALEAIAEIEHARWSGAIKSHYPEKNRRDFRIKRKHSTGQYEISWEIAQENPAAKQPAWVEELLQGKEQPDAPNA